MRSAPLHEREAERLALLRSLAILDTQHEDSFEDLARLASLLCETPIALVSLVDAERQWFKAHIGLDATETPRDLAFCAHAILKDEVLLVPDARRDPRFAGNPLVDGPPHVIFYAGAPLVSDDDLPLGTLCIIDNRPRDLAPWQIDALRTLARQVSRLITMRRTGQQLREAVIAAHEASAAMQAAHHERDLLLHHISEGLAILDREGRILAQHSAALTSWFGPVTPGVTLWSYVAPSDPTFACTFELTFHSLQEDVLPLALCLEQLPQRLRAGERALHVQYRAIGEEGAPPERLLLTVRDVTSELAEQALEAEQRGLISAFDHFVSHRLSFEAYYKDADILVEQLCRDQAMPLVEAMRLLHTLKGNSGLSGAISISALCQEIESRVAETGALSREDLERLKCRWQGLRQCFGPLLKREPSWLDVDHEDRDELVAAISAGAPRERLLQMVADWRHPSLRRQLRHLRSHALDLARRLGKPSLDVQIEDGGLRLPIERFAGLFGPLTHVVSNAIDHGVEPPAERAAAGKRAEATLVLRARRAGGRFVIEISDDGRGIDWQTLQRRAREAGLPAERREDLVQALFTDGVTTRDEVSETSGRGVGMAAVRAACRALSGEIEVESAPGRGTTFRFTLPL